MTLIPRLKTSALALAILAAVFAPSIASSQTQPQAQASDPTPFLGDWKGTLSVAGMDLQLTLHFTLTDKKELAGTVDVPDQGAMGLPLEGFKIEAKTITFLIGGVPGEPLFKGTIDATGKKLAGTFSQSSVEGSFLTDKIEK
jgi:uncharacterized protein